MFGIVELGLCVPPARMSASSISAASGVPIEFFTDKMQLASGSRWRKGGDASSWRWRRSTI